MRTYYKLLDWIDESKLYWDLLSQNPNAIHLLEQNPEKFFWYYLSSNSNAIHLLEQNQDKIDWYGLSGNTIIFVLDYQKIKEHTDIIREELMQKIFHPRCVKYYFDKYEYDILQDEFSA